MAFNLDFPERVDALLIIDTGPGFKKDEARDEWNAYALRTAEDIAQRGVAALAGGSDEQRKAVHNDIQGVARAGRGMLTQSSPRVIESLPQIRVPALVVVGADDEPFIAASNYMAGEDSGC